jgi:hypothetical protein
MFGTVLSYVTLRLLGVDSSHATAAAARRWMLAHGGATAVPSWGKFWLAVLGVYEWCAQRVCPLSAPCGRDMGCCVCTSPLAHH